MGEEETIFSSKMKHVGIFSFKDFYRFCYDWLVDETGLFLIEKKYTEKLNGNAKDLLITWVGFKEVTDYFKFKIEVVYRVLGMTKVEMTKDNQKIKSNKGTIEIKMKGTLMRDYKGKFETTGTQKFLRSIYEKWVIPSRIEEYEGKLIEQCEEFLTQAKAYLDLEGKR